MPDILQGRCYYVSVACRGSFFFLSLIHMSVAVIRFKDCPMMTLHLILECAGHGKSDEAIANY